MEEKKRLGKEGRREETHEMGDATKGLIPIAQHTLLH